MLGVKATVIRAFYDMQDPARTIYQLGETFEGDAKRVTELENKGFVKAIPEEKPAPKKRAPRKKAADA